MTTVLTVSYNTPEILERLLVSFRKFYPEVPFLVIDGSNYENYIQIKDFDKRFNIELVHFDYNIHHGPGLTEGIRRITTDQILLCDSDIIVLNGGWLEMMEHRLKPESYGIGDVQKDRCNGVLIDYLHPALALINKNIAMNFCMPIKGGAPLILAMEEIRLSGKPLLQRAEWLTDDFHHHKDKYVKHNHDRAGMGTVTKTGGYHLAFLGIVIATYQRPDGKTPYYLERTLASIDRQVYQDYHVYVIGDAYGNEEELRQIVTRHPKTSWHNLPNSPERDRYGFGNMQIWCSGGVSAVNKGIDIALQEGIRYICHQAHDDIWEPNHLQLIAHIINQEHPMFCCTLSTYPGGRVLPDLPQSNQVIPVYPLDGGMVASSTCIDYSRTKIRVMDRLHTEGIMSPCDAYLWEQLRNELISKGETGYVATVVTCHHDEEGYAIRGH